MTIRVTSVVCFCAVLFCIWFCTDVGVGARFAPFLFFNAEKFKYKVRPKSGMVKRAAIKSRCGFLLGSALIPSLILVIFFLLVGNCFTSFCSTAWVRSEERRVVK